MLEKILVPILPMHTKEAHIRIANFVQSMEAKYVHLLHVSSGGTAARLRLNDWIEKTALLYQEHTGSEVATQIAEGHPASTISYIAEELEMTLIYQWGNCKNIFWSTLLGSTTQDVIRLTETPVFIQKCIPRVFNGEEVDRILFATDFEATAQRTIAVLKNMNHWSAKLFLLNVRGRAGDPFMDQRQRESITEKMEDIKEELITYFSQVEAQRAIGSPSKHILSKAKEKKVDLIVLGRNNNSSNLNITGSTAENVIAKCRESVLLVP